MQQLVNNSKGAKAVSPSAAKDSRRFSQGDLWQAVMKVCMCACVCVCLIVFARVCVFVCVWQSRLQRCCCGVATT